MENTTVGPISGSSSTTIASVGPERSLIEERVADLLGTAPRFTNAINTVTGNCGHLRDEEVNDRVVEAYRRAIADERSGPAKPEYHTTVYIVNAVMIPNLRLLLGNVLNAINASVPNKDQNKAMTHIVRSAFDEVYLDILRRAYPDCNFGQSDGDYAVSPALRRCDVFDPVMGQTQSHL